MTVFSTEEERKEYVYCNDTVDRYIQRGLTGLELDLWHEYERECKQARIKLCQKIGEAERKWRGLIPRCSYCRWYSGRFCWEKQDMANQEQCPKWTLRLEKFD